MTLPAYYPGEKRTFQDHLTGRTVWQLTTNPDVECVHFYFTENSFVRGENAIYFLCDRDTPGVLNIFHMDLSTGDMTRTTHATDKNAIAAPTKNADGTRLLFWQGRDVVLLDTQTKSQRVLYTLEDGYVRTRLSLSCDGKTVAIQMNEDVELDHGINYAGFAEKMYRVKRSRILIVPSDGSAPARILFRDTAEGGHLQFSPTNPNLLMFCHEGPWHIVQQRIFLLDTRTGEIWPCFRQGAQDSVGHEFFTQDGLIFFDNRGPGHDGTITSSRTQAVAQETHDGTFIPYVGVADESGHVLRAYPLPHYFNHYHADNGHRLVADGVDDLFLIDLSADPPSLSPLCHHGTSWHGQHTHCHPTFDWDGKRVLFASDCGGKKVQLFLIET